jgi:hypothetical protein
LYAHVVSPFCCLLHNVTNTTLPDPYTPTSFSILK